MISSGQTTRSEVDVPVVRWIASSLLVFSAVLLALHWIHLTADPSWKFFPGHFQSLDWAGDFFTDEGWELNAASQAVMTGRWYVPGELNLAVDAPLFPILLYLPFKLFGVSMWIARFFVVGCFSASIAMIYVFLKNLVSRTDAALVVALLSADFFTFIFSRSALVELVMVFFIIAALLFAKWAALLSSKTLAFGAGLILSLGILTKLSAVSGLLPLLAVIWLLSIPQTRLSTCMTALLGIVPLPLLHRILIIKRYSQDHDYYTYINITARGVTSPKAWLLALVRIGVGLHYIGPILFLCFLVSMGVFFWKKHQPLDTVLIICSVWLISTILTFSRVTYFPPRYCLAFVFPIVILTIKFTSYVWKSNRLLAGSLYSLLALGLLFDTGQIVAYLVRPHYSWVKFAEDVNALVPQGSSRKCEMIGDISNTVSLYIGIPSVNMATGSGPKEPRIERCDPAVYIDTAPISEDTSLAFQNTNRSVTLDRKVDVMSNYKTGIPIFIYTVHKH